MRKKNRYDKDEMVRLAKEIEPVIRAAERKRARYEAQQLLERLRSVL